MKYFLTLLGVAAFIVLVFAFKGNSIGNRIFNIESSVGWNYRVLSIFKEGVKGNGEVTEEERSVANFTSISSNNAIVVKVSEGDTPKVVVRTDSNLIDHIKTKVEGGKLKVYIKGSIRRYSELMVLVSIPEINALRSSSASKILCEGKIEADNFSIRSSSASTIRIEELIANKVEIRTSSASNVKINKGYCQNLEVRSNSASDANLFGLEAENAKAQASSAGNIKVTATKELKAKANSGADISYTGDPVTISIQESSGGDVFKD